MKAFLAKSASAHVMYHDIPGAGAPLVFLHGLGCASSCDYPRIALDNSLTGRRMILIDLLGSGFSERPQHFDYTVAGHAGVIAELVAAACSGPVSVYGHSMGGGNCNLLGRTARVEGREARAE